MEDTLADARQAHLGRARPPSTKGQPSPLVPYNPTNRQPPESVTLDETASENLATTWAVVDPSSFSASYETVSIPLVFGRIYGLSTGESGLVYITQTIGSTIGLVFDHYCNRLYLRNVGKRGPEARLYSAFGGGILVPLGSFIYVFTSYPQCHWSGPAIGVVNLYTGMYLVYLTTFSYLADSYSLYAASALSAMSLMRNLVGAVFPLFTTQMYVKLGIQGAGGLTAGIATLLSGTPFVLFRYGSTLRARSPFAKEPARREGAMQAKQGGSTGTEKAIVEEA